MFIFQKVKKTISISGIFLTGCLTGIFMCLTGFTDAFSEPCQTHKMEFFTKMVNDFKMLTIFAKAPSYIFDRFLNMPLARTNPVSYALMENCSEGFW